ncbi:response regulator [candidate division WOR-3 bacterium]|nr:response regulator [candidate division WOR-3 bacterium]MCK4576556.1 response regulator [candidate division WOR-3 bacterium]
MTKRVLMVDDETVFLQAFKRLLQGSRVEADTAETFEDAMTLLKKRDYKVVIADIRLAGVLGEEGLEILKYVKKTNSETKVIIVTGYGNPDVMKKAYTLGADFYFEKPVSFKILYEAMKTFGVG